MSRIFLPSKGPDDWKAFLADPKHWKPKYSAWTLAHAWEDAEGFPPEVKAVLSGHPDLADADPLLTLPEWQVPLPGGARPSQNDIWVLAKARGELVSIAVEGKVEEPFGPTLAEWKADFSPGKTTRLAFLQSVLGLKGGLADTIRYQLLHRTASAVIEAQRFGARHAIMLVHSFSREDRWFEDFAALVSLFGERAEIGRLASTKADGGMSLHLGWVQGSEGHLHA
jgi:hypothetical protein